MLPFFIPASSPCPPCAPCGAPCGTSPPCRRCARRCASQRSRAAPACRAQAGHAGVPSHVSERTWVARRFTVCRPRWQSTALPGAWLAQTQPPPARDQPRPGATQLPSHTRLHQVGGQAAAAVGVKVRQAGGHARHRDARAHRQLHHAPPRRLPAQRRRGRGGGAGGVRRRGRHAVRPSCAARPSTPLARLQASHPTCHQPPPSAPVHHHQQPPASRPAPPPVHPPLAQVLGELGVHQQVGKARVAQVRLLDAVQEACGAAGVAQVGAGAGGQGVGK